MSDRHRTEAPDRATPPEDSPTRGRLVAIDAARGLALIGLTAIHFLPASNEETHEPTWSWILFAGDSAALFALLAGVGLAFGTGGRTRRQGQSMTAARVGVAVRALLIAAVGMSIGYLMPKDPPAVNILVYYGVFFLLTIPFLHLRPVTLVMCAMLFGVVAPVLMQILRGRLPESTAYNPTFNDVVTDPGATAAQLLLTGTYPALPYMTYLLTGLALGRLNLRNVQVQTSLVLIGAGFAAFAYLSSYVLLYIAEGYHQLLPSVPEQSEEVVDEILVWGTDEGLPTSTGWWLAVTTPHANMPLAIAWSLGIGLAVLGTFLLLARTIGPWLLPLSAMGAMTLTLYSVQLVLLSFELHYDQPEIWFLAYLLLAALFAVGWQRAFGQGPLERLVSMAAKGAGRAVVGDGTRPALH